MTTFYHLIRFQACNGLGIFFADLGREAEGPPDRGTEVTAYATLDDLASGAHPVTAAVEHVGCETLQGLPTPVANSFVAASRAVTSRRHPHLLRWPELLQPRQGGRRTLPRDILQPPPAN